MVRNARSGCFCFYSTLTTLTTTRTRSSVAETPKARRLLSLRRAKSESERSNAWWINAIVLMSSRCEMRDGKRVRRRRNISVFSFPFSFVLFLVLFRSLSRKLTRSLLLSLSLHAGCVGVVSLGDDERGIF